MTLERRGTKSQRALPPPSGCKDSTGESDVGSHVQMCVENILESNRTGGDREGLVALKRVRCDGGPPGRGVTEGWNSRR